MRYEEPERRHRMGTGGWGQPTRGRAHIPAARLTMAIVGCVLLVAAMFPPSPTPARDASGAVPARPVTHTFALFSDDSLWKAIAESGRVAVVG